MSKGFTLFEILVVSALIAILSTTLVLNFRSSSTGITARNQTVAAVISDIRRAQSMATSSTLFEDQIVCGYGVHYVGGNNYLIYARQNPEGGCASAGNHNYQQGVSVDSIVQDIFLANSSMKISASCMTGSNLSFNQGDIFFEPPDPKTYINNDPSLIAQSIDIFIQFTSAANCTKQAGIITVTPTGAINVQIQ